MPELLNDFGGTQTFHALEPLEVLRTVAVPQEDNGAQSNKRTAKKKTGTFISRSCAFRSIKSPRLNASTYLRTTALPFTVRRQQRI
jgi:hypothetical protein